MNKQREYAPKIYFDYEIGGKCGIYQVRNLINNNFYIGSTKSLLRRKGEHFDSLRLGNHWNNHLQNAFNKYGEQNFVFEVIEFCEPDIRYEIEQYWLDKFYGEDFCYNLSDKAGVPPKIDVSGKNNPMYGKHHSEESLFKNKFNQPTRKEVYCLETDKVYLSLSEASRELNISTKKISICCNFGNNPYQKYNLCFLQDVSIDNKIDKNKVKNFKTDITKINSCLPFIFCLETNKTYNTFTQAGRELSIHKDSITRCCNKEYYSAGGYHFCYTKEISTNNKLDKDKINNFKETIRPYKRQGVLIYCLETKKIYGSMQEAGRSLNVDPKSIKKCCDGTYKQSKGYHFTFYKLDI